MTYFSFNIASTSNGLLNSTVLTASVAASSVVAQVVRIDSTSTELTIHFDAALAVGDSDILTAICTAHDGTPSSEIVLPQEVSVVQSIQSSAFASKILADGTHLFKRKHGVVGGIVQPGSTGGFLFTIPYNSCKITDVEVVGSKLNDQVNFKIHDTSTGLISTVPYYPINQFGYDVFVSEGIFRESSNYDADLFLDLNLGMEYTNNGTTPVTVNFNVTLHEVK